MSGAVDLYLVYQFIRRLATPFEEWEAYKLGIIDADGTVLKKRRELRRKEERQAFGVYDTMILNIKKLLEKLPGGKTRLASYAAALYLLREWNHFTDQSLLTESISDKEISESVSLFFNGYSDYIQLQEIVNPKNDDLNNLFEQKFLEDAPTVSAGSGAIAGIGVGPDGEPGLTKAQQRRHRKRTSKSKILRRLIDGEHLKEKEHNDYISKRSSK